MKSVANIGRCYERLMKEFIVNITNECNKEGSREYHKVYVRGNCVNFSPTVINKLLGRNTNSVTNEVSSIDKVAQEITARQLKQ
jgi:hypothetical protein